jgi:CheY-like chemotaxis protein
MVGTTNVWHVTSSLLQTNLKDMLLTLFKQSGTDDRALTDKADPSPEKSCDVKSSNAHLDNAPQFAEMTVLSVDDVDMNQIIVQAFVARLGAHVDVAANGNEAINAARNKRYDLILMDVVMPVMGGVEATQILKREQPLTPVVMVTASSDASTLDKCRSSGANHVMHKPFTFEALAAQLKEVRKVSGLRVDNNPERNSSPPAGDTVPASSSVTSSSSTAQLRSSIFQPSFQSIGDKKATTRTGDDSPLSFDTISSFAGPNMLNAPSSARALPPKRRPRLFFGADVRIGSS